jgi:beta-carotene ketolase (CrtO type)
MQPRLAEEGVSMQEERFDFVVVGGGHNGTTIAAYLAKSGYSVCVLESRPECGGGQENAEPVPGFRIDPHATYLYGAAAPGFEQLELWKYGFRMVYYRSMFGLVTSDGKAVNFGSRFDRELARPYLERYAPNEVNRTGMFEAMAGEASKEFLRALFWTPPYPPEMEIEPTDLPWAQVLRKTAPQFWSDRFLEMSLVELLDELIGWEPLKVAQCMAAWYCGAHPTWEGQALPSLGGTLLVGYGSGSPRGGMHTYAHAIIRCALAHGARILTNSPVAEIIVRDGVARGVRLTDDAAFPEKTIWANKAVISAVDVQQTMLRLVGKAHLDVSFLQRVKDISLKGGSLYVISIVCRELPKYRCDLDAFPIDAYPSCVVYPCDSYENLYAQTRDVYSRKTAPELVPEHMSMMIVNHDVYDPTRCPEGYHILSPIYIQMPPPEYDVGGEDAVNRRKDEITNAALKLLQEAAPNMTEGNIVHVFVNTPQDSEFRNVGMIGGNWYAIRQSQDQWFSHRPLPELARYRTPIDRLYLCHQTSHPGGLCLMAVPYNLMHILIDDGLVEPPSWWYPSPWHISEPDAASAAA